MKEAFLKQRYCGSDQLRIYCCHYVRTQDHMMCMQDGRTHYTYAEKPSFTTKSFRTNATMMAATLYTMKHI